MPGALEATPIAALEPKALQAFGKAQKEPSQVEPKEEKVLLSKELNKERKITFDIPLDRKSDDSSSERSFETGESQPERWTTVQRKRPGKKAPRETSKERYATSDLSQEQENLVKLAETQLSKTDRRKIEARERVLNLRKTRANSAEPRTGGPSKEKGKAPDPKDWGGIDLSERPSSPIALLESRPPTYKSLKVSTQIPGPKGARDTTRK
jgi:hypothetical protein